MLNLFTTFSPRITPADDDYPYGAIKDESFPGAADGTPLKADWGNDYAGFDAAMMAAAGLTPSNSPDTALASQRFEALLNICGINFASIADMVASEAIGPGQIIRTRGYYPGWAASEVPKGAATYVTATLAQVRAAKDLPGWVPDEYGDHTLATGDVAVLLNDGNSTPYQYGAVGDGVEDDTDAWAAWDNNATGLIMPGSYLVSGVIKKYTTPTFVVTTLNNHTAGYLAFESNTTGYSNVGVGYRVLQKNTTGYDNTAVGVQAMKDNTTGNRNTAIGVDALAKNTTGDHNLALGQNALGFNTTGTYNTALGIDALEFGTTNNFNTAIGQYALLNLEASNNNVAIGYNVMQAATSGNGNCAMGFYALSEQLAVAGNTAVGTEAGRYNVTGTNITLFGFRAGRSNTGGTHLTYIGDQAGFSTLTGTHNIAVGFTSLYANTAGTYNTAVGDAALSAATGSYNTGLGGQAGLSLTTGTENTFVGYNAGVSGSQKVDAVNSSALGRGAFTTRDNFVQLGNANVESMGVGVHKMVWVASDPSGGLLTWARGDIAWNLSVVAGGSPGWVCTTAGTPGTWKAMAAVAP
jgi:hypothetical protein